jgi:AcrR family transcriptional regulator
MARTIDLRRREELLTATARHLIEHGLVDQPLSEIARAAGTSARMLIHHFDTRSALVTRALELARQWQLDEAAARVFVPGPDVLALLDAAWTWLASPATLGYFRLFQQVAAQEQLHEPQASTAFSARLRAEWEPMVTAAFAADERFADPGGAAELTITFIRGLALDLVRDPRNPRHRATYEQFLGAMGCLAGVAPTNPVSDR